jgi:phosphocarrier protein
VSCKVKIKNALGLHARPATMIAKILQGSRATVTFTYRKETINARSIMSILMLAVSRNAQILITVEGDDAETVMSNLVDVFESQFGEG